MIRHARAGAVARICPVARARARIPARRPGALEAVVVAGAVAVAVVLVRARGARIAAGLRRGRVVLHAHAGAVAGVRAVAWARAGVAARRAARLHAAMVASAVAIAEAFAPALATRGAASLGRGRVVREAGARTVTG